MFIMFGCSEYGSIWQPCLASDCMDVTVILHFWRRRGGTQREESDEENQCFLFSCVLAEQACEASGRAGLKYCMMSMYSNRLHCVFIPHPPPFSLHFNSLFTSVTNSATTVNDHPLHARRPLFYHSHILSACKMFLTDYHLRSHTWENRMRVKAYSVQYTANMWTHHL